GANLSVAPRRSITGISMGGHGALTLALTRPGFVAASSISGVVDLTLAADRAPLIDLLGPLADNRARWEAVSATQIIAAHPERARSTPLHLSVAADDRWAGANRTLHQLLDKLGIKHDYDEGTGGHTWSYWSRTLPAHVAWHRRQLDR